MVHEPDNWEHKTGYELFGVNTITADGDRMEYQHTTSTNLRAVAEGVVDNKSGSIEVYVAIFNTSTDPWEKLEPHEFYDDHLDAQDRLLELMEKHA